MACISCSTRSAPGMVGLVDDEHVGDLHDPGLDRLDIVAHAGHQHHHGHLRQAGDLDFVLPDADGLDEHVVLARGVQQQRQVGGGARQAAGHAARRHRADEDAGIGVVLLHADAVAQDRAAGDAAAGVHRDDRDGLPCGAQHARQRVDQRALARAGRAGDADHPGVAGAAPARAAASQGFRIAIFDAVAARASARASPSRIFRAHSFISSSAIAARSPGAGFRWCLRRWCTA